MSFETDVVSAKNIAKLAELLPVHLRNPQIGIVCGSGLGTLAESIRERVVVPYKTLEGFGESTVPGHRSELAFGKVGDVSVVAMLGRFHAYEGFPLDTVVYPIRFMAALGVQDVISASHTSRRLCGGMFVAMPTAMPFAPLMMRFGTRAGRTDGSKVDSS